MPEMTERQKAAWPEAVAEAQRYVDSTIPTDLADHYWRVRWDDESRPGRGHMMWATWANGEHFVEISMDVYGYPRVSVAEMTWLHNSSDEDCDCEPCAADRAEDEGDG
ncbi:hypothetical protein SOM10_11950 [Microbacterium sp. CFBP9023]|uniref:hypothetical protein n=1 Tax=Microbacterium sp. CFBP9023 TaxID=3096535 RepID=UPI002A6B324A|nr:hypothetical protein [Microbacterium sp. CFBP9023]MDY0984608.1 hypothetical protein [Microbacterium sp. CFBP9023]